MYSWKELRSFWISEARGVEILRLDTTLHFVHTVEILLTDVDSAQIRDLLQKHIPMLERASPEAGAMADHALVSVANKIPFRDKLLDWVESSTGYAANNQQSNPKN
jgi:hypothetical protein